MTPNNNDYNPVTSILTVIVVLAIIIALIVLLIRFLGRRNQMFSKSRSIRTLGAVGLGQNKSLQVIEIGSSIYLVGVGEDVTLVDKISDPQQVAQLVGAFEEEAADLGSLSSIVATLKTRFRKGAPAVEEELDSTTFHEVFETKLRDLPNRKKQMEEILQEEQSTDRLRNP
ncbi:flagellar protein [Paenibacillus sp. CAA11]|uniref:flagellar biosynthetic protein FliO n=1 Tax=Paenibacillus sp. CAA11 TaxID=1532905 RepID=UPI000D350694|nr:flagellar biosynthetic protein FliO [Paenibacillus sp. CAA11]AWB44307.1 flagellar protein [Paenibacillus sp. CAA11]